MGESLDDFWIRQSFWLCTKSVSQKKDIDGKLDFVKIKAFVRTSKGTIKKMKRQVTDWEKIS